MSLIELLVSVTILAIAMTVGLQIYQEAQRSYRRGENHVEQQQVARVAFDLISNELRMAGLNLYPDGDHNRPDEAIEAAFERAIVIRADFDRDEGAAARQPEESLAGAKFVTVSTGNDEIHAFVLAKSLPNGTATGDDSLTFEADVAEDLRDGEVESVAIDNIVLGGSEPPYTLYRVSLDNDASSYGSGGFVNRTVLADNIESLRFRYFDLAGNELTPPGGAEDAASVSARAAIHRVTVELETRTRHPDPTTMTYRSLAMTGRVTPRNRGRIRIPDGEGGLTEPSAPGIPAVLSGHCGGLLVQWPSNPAHEQVSYYRILFGEDPSTPDQVAATTLTEHYLDLLTDGTDYTVRIEAVNYAGMPGPPSAPATVRTSNSNVPQRPENLATSVSPEEELAVSWDAVTANTVSTPDALLRDLAGYRVYRGSDPGFTPGPGNLLADESEIFAEEFPFFHDRYTVGCRDYSYVATAVDRCGLESAVSDVRTGQVVRTDPPGAPASVHAYAVSGQLKLTWQTVQDDVNGRPIWIDNYRIYRSPPTDPSLPPDDTSGFIWLATVNNSTQFFDFLRADGRVYWYAVQADDDCPGNDGALSEMTAATCSFQGSVVFDRPDYHSQGGPGIDLRVVVENPVGGYDGLQLTFVNDDDDSTYTVPVTGAGPSWDYRMELSPLGAFTEGWYTVRAEVTQWDGSVSCPNSATLRFQLTDD